MADTVVIEGDGGSDDAAVALAAGAAAVEAAVAAEEAAEATVAAEEAVAVAEAALAASGGCCEHCGELRARLDEVGSRLDTHGHPEVEEVVEESMSPEVVVNEEIVAEVEKPKRSVKKEKRRYGNSAWFGG